MRDRDVGGGGTTHVRACYDFLKMNSGFAVFVFRQVALAYTRHHEDATYQTCSQLTCIFLYKNC